MRRDANEAMEKTLPIVIAYGHSKEMSLGVRPTEVGSTRNEVYVRKRIGALLGVRPQYFHWNTPGAATEAASERYPLYFLLMDHIMFTWEQQLYKSLIISSCFLITLIILL